MSEKHFITWFDNFLGVAYRYYDLRMNIVPLFSDRKKAIKIWQDVVHWWLNHSIKIRFVETGDNYWFILAGESTRPVKNMSFFKFLTKSKHYERFKKGHQGEAFLRLGVYTKKTSKDARGDAVCDCGHPLEDHYDEEVASCMIEDCQCQNFESFQVNLLKKKKTITDIKFLQEQEVKEDALAWNCLNANKYKKRD
ncbi:MAG: hypothetical protein ACE5JT_03335 [Nitrosopumilaceae archaeon]